jgi:hypothetical protein
MDYEMGQKITSLSYRVKEDGEVPLDSKNAMELVAHEFKVAGVGTCEIICSAHPIIVETAKILQKAFAKARIEAGEININPGLKAAELMKRSASRQKNVGSDASKQSAVRIVGGATSLIYTAEIWGSKKAAYAPSA